jgi:3'-phosphoadenosine 5'-phosphosulfate sulfotransferase (PAPS reductase)/FAD synthetase
VRHIVALSGGKDSTAMALRLVETEPRDYEFVCTPTGNELPEMVAHWARLRTMLGGRFTVLSSGKSLVGEIKRQGALPNWRMRWCTRILKIEPYNAFMLAAAPATSYVGIRADEADREGIEYKNGGIVTRFPLVEWGWGLEQVKSYLAERGIVIPKRTDCAMCFFQRLGEWWQLWREHPDLYAEAEGLERATGHTLRSEGRDSWPAALVDLRAAFEGGRVPRGAETATQDERRVMCGTCAR